MKTGSIVMFTDMPINTKPGAHTLHSVYPEFFPPVKTIGMVTGTTHVNDCEVFFVKWPSGSILTGPCSICAPQSLLDLTSNP